MVYLRGCRARGRGCLAAGVVGLALALLVVADEGGAAHTRLLVGDEVQMGIAVSENYQGHHDAPASLGSGTTWALLRYSPTGSLGAAFEGVTRNYPGGPYYRQDAWLSWGAGSMASPFMDSGGCRQTPADTPDCTETDGNSGPTVYTPSAPYPMAITECSSYWHRVDTGIFGTLPDGKKTANFRISHDYCPIKDNVYRNNITIVNEYVDVTIPDVHYRRAMEWNAETVAASMGAPQYVTIGGTSPPPSALVGFGDDGRMTYDVWTPITSPVCAPSGMYFTNCTTGKGLVFDLNVGDIPPLGESRFCVLYGGAPSFAAALAELRDLNVELYSIAYRGSDSPATFFVGIGCLSPPIVDFMWAAEPHIHAPSGWTPLTACVGSKVTFSDLSYLNGLVKGDPTKSAWGFGDGNGTTTSWSDEVTHTYTAPATYNVTLTVWGADERSATVTKSIEVIDCLPPPPVNEAPVIMALPCRTVTEGSLVTFRLVAFDPDGPPDPPPFYTLTFMLQGAPPGAQVIGNLFRWEASALGEHRFKVQVRDGGPPVLMDETEACITVYPRPPAPESSDADGDGVPDAHDPCPATAGASGCPADASRDREGDADGKQGEQSGVAGICGVEALLPREVSGRIEEQAAVIGWRAPVDCAVDRFLVWNGTGGHLVAVVPFDPAVDVYEARDPDPWHRPHRYYVQAEPTPGEDVFVYPRAVPTEILALRACTDCDGQAPAGDVQDVPPINAASFLTGIGHGGALLWIPLLVVLLGWLLWRNAGLLVRLFSRIDDEKALEHPTRALLHETVAAEPGIHARELARRLDKARGVVRHHLGILVAAGLLHARKGEGYTRYYLAEADAREPEGARTDLARRILATVRDRPGMNITELADGLGVNRNAVRYHLQRFREAGLVDLERTPGGVIARTSAAEG